MGITFNPFTGTLDFTGAGGGSGGTPALPFDSVQYNNAGAFGGDANFTWDGSLLTANGAYSAVASTTRHNFHYIENDAPDTGSNLNLIGYSAYIATNGTNTHDQVSIKGADIVGEHDGSGSITFVGGVDGDGELYGTHADQCVGVRGLAHNNSIGTITDMAAFITLYGNGGAGLVTNAYGTLVIEDNLGGPITNNYGFFASALAQGTNNYGFYSAVSAAATNWAFYGAGTAKSHFGGAIDSSSTVTATDFLGGNWQGKTLTLGGNLTTSGAFASTFTMTGATGVTFPTSGTLATTSQIPSGAALTKGDDTNVTLTLGGSASTALVNAASIAAGWAGTLSVARGGSGAGTLTGLVLGNGTSAFTTVTAPSGTVVGTSDTQTLTNKRITKRVTTASDATSITPNSDNADITYQANTQAVGTLTINADGGTPTNGQGWVLKIKSTNVQTFSWNAIYVGGAVPLPTTTSGSSKIDYFAFVYDTVTPKWDYTGPALGY